MDGVIADFHLAIDVLFKKKIRTSWRYNIWNRYGVSKEVFWKKANTFDFWAGIPLIEGAHILHEKLVALDEVEILTLAQRHPACREGKIDWLSRYFPDIKYHITYDKTPYYRDGRNKHVILVDDYPGNIVKCNLAGGYGVLYPAVDNELCDFLSVDTGITHDYILAMVKLGMKLRGRKNEFNTLRINRG